MANLPAMECEADNCDYITTVVSDKPEHLLQQMSNHIAVKHTNAHQRQQQNGGGQQARPPKAGECPKWMETHPFEIYEKEMQVWSQAATEEGLTDAVKLFRLKESLKVCPRTDVKDYFIKTLVLDGVSTETWVRLMEKLKTKFALNKDEEWTHTVRKIRKFEWNDRKASEVMEDIERIALELEKLSKMADGTEMTRKEFIQRLLAKELLVEQGKLEKKFETAEIMQIEKEIKDKNYDWDTVKKVMEETKIKREREQISEVHYGNSWDGRSRPPFRKRSQSYQRKNYPKSSTPSNQYRGSQTRNDSRTRNRSNSSTPKNKHSPFRKQDGNKKKDKDYVTNQEIMTKIESLDKRTNYLASSMKLLLDSKAANLNDSYASNSGENAGSADNSLLGTGLHNPTHFVSKVPNVCKVSPIYYTQKEKNGGTIDTGAPLNVCGKPWLKDFMEKML